MNQRIKKVISSFDSSKIDALLVLKDINIRYLTQFPAEESCLIVCKKKIFYITDSRYYLSAKNQLTGCNVKCFKKSMWEEIASIVKSQKIKGLGLNESHINVAQYRLLKKNLKPKVKLVSVKSLVESVRSIKEPAEVECIRQALKIHREAHSYLKKIIKPKLTEKEILRKLEDFVRSKGATFSFDPIIASGVNSCFPHAKVTSRKVLSNDLVLVDMGIDLNGYKSDLTRMFFLGRIAKSIREIQGHVSFAQQEAMKQIKAGVEARVVDQVARNYFAKQGISKHFTHALGHGVGLEVHENPRLSPLSKEKLQEGMIVTVEPAIYLANQFGIRLEEMVLVTKEGCEQLSDNIN